MKRGKRILAFVLLAAMLLCLSGCGSFASKIAKASKKMGELQNYHMDMEMQIEMSMEVLGQSSDMDMTVTMGADIQEEPLRIKMNMTTKMLGESLQTLGYVEQDGTDLVSYSSDNGGAFWTKQTVTEEDLPDMRQDMQMFADCVDSFQEAGKEQVNGSDATRYDGEISGESLNIAMEASGAWDIMGDSLGVELEEDDLTDLGSIPCSVWIDNKSGMIVRYDMDMTQVMNAMLDTMMGSILEQEGLDAGEMKISLGKVTTSIELSWFDQVGEIVIPEDVRAAAEKDTAILGTWKSDVDCLDLLLEEMGEVEVGDRGFADYIDSFTLPVYMSFEEDGTYTMWLDKSSLEKETDRFSDAMANFLMDYFVEGVFEELIEAGYADGSETVEELESWLGMTMEDFFTYQIGESAADMAQDTADEMMLVFMYEISSEGTYLAQGGKLYMADYEEGEIDPDSYESYEISGSTLTILSGSDDDDDNWFYPFVLEKQD